LTNKKEVGQLLFFLSYFRFALLCIFGFDDTPSVFLIRCRNVRRRRKGLFLGFRKYERGSEYFDSESAVTPSLGRRVGTEASGGRQCCCAIVLPASWALLAFCFFYVCTYCYEVVCHVCITM
jgi:hypothetical protein